MQNSSQMIEKIVFSNLKYSLSHKIIISSKKACVFCLDYVIMYHNQWLKTSVPSWEEIVFLVLNICNTIGAQSWQNTVGSFVSFDKRYSESKQRKWIHWYNWENPFTKKHEIALAALAKRRHVSKKSIVIVLLAKRHLLSMMLK